MLRRKVNIGFAFAVFLTVLLSALSWRASRQAAEDADWVAHTHQVSATLELTLRHLDDVETGDRGFALTGREPFLEPFEAGKFAVVQDLQALRRLTADNPDQQRRLDILVQQANSRIGMSSDIVAFRRSSSTPPTIAQLEHGKRLMDDARSTIEKMESEETRLLELRTQATRGAQRFNISAIGLGLIIEVIFLSLAGTTVSREIGVSTRARAQVNALNANLREQATLLDLAHDAIVVRDLQSRVVFWNRSAQNLYGWSAGEALGKVTHDFLQTTFPQPLATIEVELASKGDWEGELLHRTRHGTEVIVASRWSLQRDERGLPVAILEINRDITDRKRAEAALSDSEGRLAGIIASAMDSIITVDDEQRIVLFNRAAEKMFQCPAEEAIGQSISRFIPKRFHARHVEHVRKFGKTGITNRAMGPKDVLWALRADGQEFQIEASISHVVTGGKKLFTVILRDVTERRQIEEVRERLAAVVECSDDAIISKDLDGTINAWNRGAEKVFGYSSAEALGKPMVMLFPPDRVNEESDILARIRQGESIEHYETERIRKDGTRIFVSVTISPIRDGRGEIVGASKIARDITEGKRSQRELARQAEELLRSRQALESQALMLKSVLDSMVEGLVAADEQGKFILWNPAAEKILGLGPADIPPEEWSAHYCVYMPDMITPFPAEDVTLLRAIRGEVSSTEMFIRNPGLDRTAWIEVNGAPLRDSSGAVRGGVVAFRNITQRKADELEIRKLNENLEEKIAERTAQLEAANRELQAFSYSVSHDLRAPLRHIGSFARILAQDFGSAMDPEARRHLERIENGARRMTLLVDGLLTLARLGPQSLKLSLTGLNAIVDGAISVLRPECDGRDLEWRIARLPAMECDPILMGQVFQNLLGNALKYSRRRPKAVIEIGSIQGADNQPVIFVRDNGAGFSMQHAGKLFGVFQRLHTEAEFEGTGVGLATVHRIIQKHKGSIWAESEPDHGATFYFTVGVKESANASKKASPNGALEHVRE